MSLRNSLSTAELNWYERLNAAHRRAAEFLRADRTILADAERLAGALIAPCAFERGDEGPWCRSHGVFVSPTMCAPCRLHHHWREIAKLMESQP